MNKTKKYHCVATIAGSDPSGGAGIQADIKTISALGCYAASIITALTAQNTQGVQGILEIPADFIQQQIDAVFSDLDIKAVKIGMLYSKKIIDIVATALKKYKPAYSIVDPVMIAKSGHHLLEPDTVKHLQNELFPFVTLITPNIPETETLLDIKINGITNMEAAAIKLGNQAKTNVLVKGGHLSAQQSSDVLYLYDEQYCYWFDSPRIATKNTHGTGCTLSSAIASYLAQDHSLIEAVKLAKQYLTSAIEAGKSLHIGHGYGPVDHFYKF